MPAHADALQQGRAFSHHASDAMWSRASIRVEALLIGFERCPVDESRVMFREEHAPLVPRKMTHAFFDVAVFIDVAFPSALAVSISASIHRIGQDVMNRGVSRNNPTNLSTRAFLQRKRRSLRTQPKPDPPCGAELGEALEDRADRGGDRFIGMEQNFTVGLSPYEAHRQTPAQLAAGIEYDIVARPAGLPDDFQPQQGAALQFLSIKAIDPTPPAGLISVRGLV